MGTALETIVVLAFAMAGIAQDPADDKGAALSRRKRYVVFPEGASLTIEFCFTINLNEVPTEIFTEVINLGMNYDLPNKTGFELLRNLEEPKHVVQRRNRRDIYRKTEIIFDAMGYDGRACIYRALCEAAQNFNAKGENIMEELLRLIFKFPLQRLDNYEPEEHRLYHWAHRMGYERKNCLQQFPSCPVSIIDMVLGYRKSIFNDIIDQT